MSDQDLEIELFDSPGTVDDLTEEQIDELLGDDDTLENNHRKRVFGSSEAKFVANGNKRVTGSEAVEKPRSQLLRLPNQMTQIYYNRIRDMFPVALAMHYANNRLESLTETIEDYDKKRIKLKNAYKKKIGDMRNHYEKLWEGIKKELESERAKSAKLQEELTASNLQNSMLAHHASQVNHYNAKINQPQRKRAAINVAPARQRNVVNPPVQAVIQSQAATQNVPIQQQFQTPPARTTLRAMPQPIEQQPAVAPPLLFLHEPVEPNLPNRITINVALVRQSAFAAANPFDTRAPAAYPPGMQKSLALDRIEIIDVSVHTEYDDFLVSKKLHGLIKFNINSNELSQPGAHVQIYYFVDSLHSTWIKSEAAKLSQNGTKFTVCFAAEQKLYNGDRISFFAFVYINQTTKFISHQLQFKMRRPNEGESPVAKETPPPINPRLSN